MSNTTPTSPRGADAADDSHFTIEDAGSTTDAADLFHNDTTAGTGDDATSQESPRASANEVASAATTAGPGSQAQGSASAPAVAVSAQGRHASNGSSVEPAGAPGAPPAPGSPGAQGGGRGALVDDYAIGHVFDQTNGVIEGADGDSDGTAESDTASGAERADGNPAFAGFETGASADGDDSGRIGS
jgi:hypothetical protein